MYVYNLHTELKTGREIKFRNDKCSCFKFIMTDNCIECLSPVAPEARDGRYSNAHPPPPSVRHV